MTKVIDVCDREYWRLLLIQLMVCVPFWALAGWIVNDVIDTNSFISFLASAHIPGLLDVEVTIGHEIQMSIIGYYLDPTAVAAGVITILTVESLSFAICASLYLVTLRAAGRQVTVITGLRLAARRGWPVLGWTLVSLAIVVIGFQVPLFADLFLGTPIAILASTVAGIGLLTVFAASLIGVITFERAGPIRCFELIVGGWWPTFARLLLAWLIAMIYGAVVAYFQAGSASESMPPILQLTLWGLLSVPVGVLASAVHIVTYAEHVPHHRGTCRRNRPRSRYAPPVTASTNHSVRPTGIRYRGQRDHAQPARARRAVHRPPPASDQARGRPVHDRAGGKSGAWYRNYRGRPAGFRVRVCVLQLGGAYPPKPFFRTDRRPRPIPHQLRVNRYLPR